MNTLEVNDLSCIRGTVRILHGIHFELNRGHALLIEGTNGSGKSTLLRLLTGLSTPTSGEVRWCQQSIAIHPDDYRAALHYIGHQNGIKLGLTVIENLRWIQQLTQSTPTSFESILTQLQLDAYQHTQAMHLSAGQKRRLALAKLFLFPKSLWLLDEPLTALDTQTQSYFLMQLDTHLQQGGLAVISSHHVISLPQAQKLRLGTC